MKVAIIGYGKMGREIEKIALNRGHEIVLKINDSNLSELNENNLQEVDVAIEFTAPQHAVNNILTCFITQTPVVVGTTGWYDQFEEVKQACTANNATLLHATNCSIGVNIFFKLNEMLAKVMNRYNDYDVNIEETHHTQKLDAPSGTAITLGEGILENIDRKNNWVKEATTKTEELSIVSHRIENVPGTHQINYQSEIDDITITHTAHNRKGFALGAVIAAEYIYDKKGIFTMSDVLFNSKDN